MSEAEKLPGVVRILTTRTCRTTSTRSSCLIQVEPDDEPVLAADQVRYKGEPIVAVLAETEAAAHEAARAVQGRPTRSCRRCSTSRRR